MLWALTPTGIVLNNFALSLFIELDAPGKTIWAYLDGTHGAEEVAMQIADRFPEQLDRTAAMQRVASTIEQLVSGGFVRERQDDPRA